MTNGQAGKGDRYRTVDQTKYAVNYEKAFPKKKSKKKNSKKGIMQAGGEDGNNVKEEN